MFRRGHGFFVAALLPLLSACNLVVSEEPWFDSTDAVRAPALREGLWLNLSDPDCRVDEAKPAEQWPDCAGATYVRGNEWLPMQWEEVGKGRRARRTFAGWEILPVLLAGGTPLIMQVQAEVAPKGPPEDSADTSEAEFDWRYWYMALRPTQLDEAGRVTAFESWTVQCGPEPTGREPGPVTEQPFPELTIVENNCVAEDAEALRQAAGLSEGLGEHIRSRWVREGWR